MAQEVVTMRHEETVRPLGVGIGIGAGIGGGLGLVFGMLVGGDISLGLVFGAGIGVLLGLLGEAVAAGRAGASAEPGGTTGRRVTGHGRPIGKGNER
jgi:hypothetical protein